MGSDFHNSYHWVCCCWRWWILSHITSVRIHFIGCCRNSFTIYTWSHFCFFTFRWFIVFFITCCERNWCFFNFWFCSDFVNIIFRFDMVSFIDMNFIITCQYNWAIIIYNVVFSILIDSKRFTGNDNSIALVNHTVTFFIFTIWIVFPYSWFIVTILGIIRKSRINNMRIFRIFVFVVNLTITIFVIQFFKQFWQWIIRRIVFTWYNKTSSIIPFFYKFRCLIVLLIISNVFLTFWNNHFITAIRGT